MLLNSVLNIISEYRNIEISEHECLYLFASTDHAFAGQSRGCVRHNVLLSKVTKMDERWGISGILNDKYSTVLEWGVIFTCCYKKMQNYGYHELYL